MRAFFYSWDRILIKGSVPFTLIRFALKGMGSESGARVGGTKLNKPITSKRHYQMKVDVLTLNQVILIVSYWPLVKVRESVKNALC